MAKTEVKSTQIKQLTILVDDMRDFGPEDGGGLNLDIKAGRIRDDNTITNVSAVVVALTDNTTNFVEIDSVGAATANTSAFTTGRIPIATVVTVSADITSITDKRSWVMADNTNPDISARVFNSAAISLANNTNVVPTFNSEVFDTDGLHSTSVNTDRLTAPVSGKYLITTTISFALNATGIRRIKIRKNGGGSLATVLVDATTSGSSTTLSISTIIDLVATDFVSLLLRQQSGGALDVEANADSPYLSMIRIA